MEWQWIAPAVSLVTAIGAFVAAIKARAEANKLAESEAVSVTVSTAGNLVELVNAQLTRSASEMGRLIERVQNVEDKLTVAEGTIASLRMQLGKGLKRIGILEAFIRTLGHEPPPDQETV